MILSLDSSTVVDLLRGRDKRVREHFRAAKVAGTEMMFSTLALSEIAFGVSKGDPAQRVGKLRRLSEILDDLAVVVFDDDDAMAAGQLRADLPRGREIGAIDTLMAGQALARGWTIVTSNIRHFGRIVGVRLIDWRISDRPLTFPEIMVRLRETED